MEGGRRTTEGEAAARRSSRRHAAAPAPEPDADPPHVNLARAALPCGPTGAQRRRGTEAASAARYCGPRVGGRRGGEPRAPPPACCSDSFHRGGPAEALNSGPAPRPPHSRAESAAVAVRAGPG